MNQAPAGLNTLIASGDVVPPPEPSLLPMGSDVQNQSVWLTSSSLWKQWIKLGGKDNNFCIVESALA